jgi:hypothetical protein
VSNATELFDRAVRAETAAARAEGALDEVSRQLRAALALIATLREAAREHRGEMGDVRDALDGLTVLRGDDLRVGLDDLIKHLNREDVEPTGPDMTSREVYGVGR